MMSDPPVDGGEDAPIDPAKADPDQPYVQEEPAAEPAADQDPPADVDPTPDSGSEDVAPEPDPA